MVRLEGNSCKCNEVRLRRVTHATGHKEIPPTGVGFSTYSSMVYLYIVHVSGAVIVAARHRTALHEHGINKDSGTRA